VEISQTQYDNPIPLGSNLDWARNGKGDYERADSNADARIVVIDAILFPVFSAGIFPR